MDNKKTVEIKETCPHCNTENNALVDEDAWTVECSGCGKRIVLCNKCMALHPDENERPCEDCLMCDLANFMNYLKGGISIEKLLGSFNPPLTDMTTGIPVDGVASLDNYINDAYGDDVNWDVKYWDIYRMVSECFLNSESTEKDCLEFISDVIERNKK